MRKILRVTSKQEFDEVFCLPNNKVLLDYDNLFRDYLNSNSINSTIG